jgi:hypothetical protein
VDDFGDIFLGPGSGILSALLAAYDRQQNRFSSVASTPLSTDTDLPHHTREHHHHDHHHHTSASQAHVLRRRKRDISLESIISKISREDNIPTTRSAAGVFGPLLVATGNLSSIAAPVNSSVAPDLKRRGYRLSRYTHAAPEQVSQPPSGAGSTPLSPVGTRQDNLQAGTPTNINAPNDSPLTMKGKGTWSSTFKGLSSGLSSRHRSPETTDTEGDGIRIKRHQHRKTKRKREEIYVSLHIHNIIIIHSVSN